MTRRRLRDAAIMSLFGLGVLGIALSNAGAKDDEGPSIKEIMKALNKGGTAESAKLKKALAAEAPDWKVIQASSKEFATLGTKLGQDEPPKGELDSWKTLTNTYAEDCKALDAAADKEDLAGTKAAFQKL